VSTQVAPHKVRPSAHASVQRPPLASQSGCVAGQRVAQSPQLVGEVRSVSQPSPGLVQSAQPGSQAVAGITQRPAAQRTPSAPAST
jgi:hypothetical protein